MNEFNDFILGHFEEEQERIGLAKQSVIIDVIIEDLDRGLFSLIDVNNSQSKPLQIIDGAHSPFFHFWSSPVINSNFQRKLEGLISDCEAVVDSKNPDVVHKKGKTERYFIMAGILNQHFNTPKKIS